MHKDLGGSAGQRCDTPPNRGPSGSRYRGRGRAPARLSGGADRRRFYRSSSSRSRFRPLGRWFRLRRSPARPHPEHAWAGCAIERSARHRRAGAMELSYRLLGLQSVVSRRAVLLVVAGLVGACGFGIGAHCLPVMARDIVIGANTGERWLLFAAALRGVWAAWMEFAPRRWVDQV